MGMSTHTIGIKPANERWEDMKKIFDACRAAGVKLPEEVMDFFDGEFPDDEGVLIKLSNSGCVEEWNDCDGTRTGFQVDLEHLPKDIKYIRFYNSW